MTQARMYRLMQRRQEALYKAKQLKMDYIWVTMTMMSRYPFKLNRWFLCSSSIATYFWATHKFWRPWLRPSTRWWHRCSPRRGNSQTFGLNPSKIRWESQREKKKVATKSPWFTPACWSIWNDPRPDDWSSSSRSGMENLISSLPKTISSCR